jgi:hypothetical protein
MNRLEIALRLLEADVIRSQNIDLNSCNHNAYLAVQMADHLMKENQKLPIDPSVFQSPLHKPGSIMFVEHNSPAMVASLQRLNDTQAESIRKDKIKIEAAIRALEEISVILVDYDFPAKNKIYKIARDTIGRLMGTIE